MLAEKYPDEIKAILGKYPPDQKRAAVMPLLYLAQQEHGYVTKQALSDIAEILGISTTDVASIVGFYTLFHAVPEGKYRIQVCNDLPCALRGADQFLEKLCENLGVRVGETTADGLLTVEAVTCLAGCDRAPLFQVQTGSGLEYHEDQTVEKALALVESWRATEQAPETTPAEAEGELITPIAAQGITRLPAEQRIRIQEQGGQ